MMDVKHYTDPAAASNLKALFKASRAIPFFGTGFTRDCKSKNGKVPDANALAELITRTATLKAGLDSAAISEIKSIKDLKTAFEFLTTERFIDAGQRQALLGNLFSRVELGSVVKRSLLNLEWPHVLSFNIDDAIELAAPKYQVILPNRPVSREFISANNCLFKIHGDINDYIKYRDPNVIFTWRQYAQSLKTNAAMLSFLEQAQHIAFLFIGCSLDGEFDLLHIDAKRQFVNSIYFKKGKVTISEELRLESYGIEQVITFDTYDQIYEWLYETLKDEQCETPFKDLTIDESVKNSQDAIEVIANGGPLIFDDHSGRRIGRKLSIFPKRKELPELAEALRSEQYVFITGRRFSGKTQFMLQLLGDMQHYSFYYYSSTDVFSADLKRLINGVENSLFLFDSNYLDVDGLDSLLSWNTHHTNRIVICASSGDAEILRYTFQKRGIKIYEKRIDSGLFEPQVSMFNAELAKYALPDYAVGETLLNFAYRYYDAYKSTLTRSTMFGTKIEIADFEILVIALAFGKAVEPVVLSVNPYFDFIAFVKNYDRIFELEVDAVSGKVLICNSSSWLLSRVEEFIKTSTDDAIEAVSEIISKLVAKGFQTSAYSLITFNKLNELCGKSSENDKFIRGIYRKVESAFQGNEHYWLQRAKCELVMGATAGAIAEGIRFAMPLRVNNRIQKNQTYFSATLILAQLFSRSYKFEGKNDVLLELIDFYLESIKNYANNKRHIDKVVLDYTKRRSDTRFTLDSLETATDARLLVRKKDIQEILSFFRVRSS